jgi:phage host-nuclease inhibitor protein Gam
MTKSTRRVTKSAADMMTPKTDDEARHMLAKLGLIDREIKRVDELATAQIAAARADQKAFTDLRLGEAKLIHLALQNYFTAHETRLTDGGKRRAVQWPEGSMGHRLSKPKVKLLLEEEDVLDELEARGLDHLIRQTQSIAKDVILAADPEDIAHLADLLTIDQRKEFFATAAAEPSERSIEVERTAGEVR